MQRENEVGFGTYLKILKRYLWILVIIPLLTTASTYTIVKNFVTPEYKTSTLLIIEKSYSQHKDTENNDIVVPQQLINSCIQIMHQKITKDLIETYNLETIQNKVEITQISGTQLIRINVIDSDPNKSANMANHFANATIKEISLILPSYFIKVLDAAEVPREPFKPNLRIYISASVILGTMLSLGIISLLALSNNKLYSSEDITNHLDLPILGIIPTLKE